MPRKDDYKLVPTTVYLTKEHMKSLERISKMYGVPYARTVRDALDWYLNKMKRTGTA